MVGYAALTHPTIYLLIYMLNHPGFWIFLGAAIGGLCRFTLAGSFRTFTRLPGWVPILIANILGSFLIGLLYVVLQDSAVNIQLGNSKLTTPMLYALGITGFCGGLTTYSTFSLDNVFLIYEKQWLALSINLIGSITLCLLAVHLGISLFNISEGVK